MYHYAVTKARMILKHEKNMGEQKQPSSQLNNSAFLVNQTEYLNRYGAMDKAFASRTAG